MAATRKGFASDRTFAVKGFSVPIRADERAC